MRTDKRTTAVFSTVLIVALAGCVALLGPMDRLRASGDEDTLYIPSPSVIKSLSFGYTGLVADLYWTRAVQYFGERHYQKATSYDLLFPLLDITTTLDPHLLVAYQFGSMFLSQQPPDGAGQPDKAIGLVERGITANPNDWKLYYNLGFIYYDMAAYSQASNAFARGAQVPGGEPRASRPGCHDRREGRWTRHRTPAVDEIVRIIRQPLDPQQRPPASRGAQD